MSLVIHVCFEAVNGLKSDVAPCPKSAKKRKSAVRMQTAAASPSIEISLIEWMSGILSKIRILPDD